MSVQGCCGCPAVPMGGSPTIAAGAAGDSGLRLLLFALGPISASTGCQLKLKPKQAQPEQCQGMGSAGKERGRNLAGGAGPGEQGACASKCSLL